MAVRGIVALVAVALVATLAALAAPTTASPASPAHRATASALETGVLRDLNAIRRRNGLVPLRLNAKLTAAAASHSRDMATRGYFQHDSLDGTAFWKRIDRWYGQGRFRLWAVGENLLWSSPDVAPAKALDLWMHSPEHRKNILTPKWREIGVAAVHASAAPGTYNGLAVTIITTDFGVRR